MGRWLQWMRTNEKGVLCYPLHYVANLPKPYLVQFPDRPSAIDAMSQVAFCTPFSEWNLYIIEPLHSPLPAGLDLDDLARWERQIVAVEGLSVSLVSNVVVYDAYHVLRRTEDYVVWCDDRAHCMYPLQLARDRSSGKLRCIHYSHGVGLPLPPFGPRTMTLEETADWITEFSLEHPP